MGCDYVKYKSVDFIPGKKRSRGKKTKKEKAQLSSGCQAEHS